MIPEFLQSIGYSSQFEIAPSDAMKRQRARAAREEELRSDNDVFAQRVWGKSWPMFSLLTFGRIYA